MKTLLVILSLLLAAPVLSDTITLNPQPGVVLLGVSCGGIHTSTYVTGFDKNGNITGQVHAWTRCGHSGRGGGYRSRLYYKWHSIVWDLNGVALATLHYDGIVPDAAFKETDAAGNTISTTQLQTSFWPAFIGVLKTP